MFDSHCHLTDIDDPALALEQAHAAGVRNVLTCGYHEESNRAVLELIENRPALLFSLGLHPWFADQDVGKVLALIDRLRPPVIGELGLDLWGETPPQPFELQAHVLEAQLELAVRFDVPVTIHSRKAIEPLLSILRNHRGIRGALHAFSGSFEQARPFLELGLYIGVGGAVTRSRASRVRRCASMIPVERIVVETDAPAIGLDIVEPPHVRPAHLVRVVEALAELRHVDREKLDNQLDENVRELFGARAFPRG